MPAEGKVIFADPSVRSRAEHFRAYMTPLQLERHKTAKKRQTVLGLICDSLRNQEAVEELLPDFSSDTKEEASVLSKEKKRAKKPSARRSAKKKKTTRKKRLS